MLKNEILEVLEDNNLGEVEVLKEEEDSLLIKFFFDFDDAVIAAARAYSNEESTHKEESNEWYKEYYLPYLYDFANDEVVEMIEEIIDRYDISGEVMGMQMDSSNSGFTQFFALFTDNDNTITMEDVVKEFVF